MRRFVAAAVVVMTAGGMLGARQLQTPADWKWRFDEPAAVTNQGTAVDSKKVYFVAMPPGWHMTTGPGALLYSPDHSGRGNFAVEMDVFLFPDSSDQEYGVFVGGRELDPTSTAAVYTAFVLRRDGQAAVVKRSGTRETMLVNWMPNAAASPLPAGGKDDVKNVLRVEVGPVDVAFSANGKPITSVPRADVLPDGHIGFRVGRGMNLHASQLTVSYKLAPVRR